MLLAFFGDRRRLLLPARSAAQAASKAGVDRIPQGLEIQYNEFAKMIMEESQRMIIQDLDPKAVAATMQAKAEAIQKQ